MFRVLLAGVFFLASSIASANLCKKWSEPQKVGQLNTLAISEASGLAISKQFPNRMYHHNDSQDGGLFYVTDMTGANTLAIPFTSEKVRDVEDMSLGPCDQGQCLFIGDIGDNNLERKEISLWIVPETQNFVNVEFHSRKITLQYPDGAHNAESLVVHPITGDVYILTKELNVEDRRANPGRLYRLPKSEHTRNSATLQYVGLIDLPWMNYDFGVFGGIATSMDISPDGNNLLILTYDNAVEINLDKVLKETPTTRKWKEDKDYRILSIRHLVSQQEAVAYSPDGKSFYFDSEFNEEEGDKEAPLYRVDCLKY